MKYQAYLNEISNQSRGYDNDRYADILEELGFDNLGNNGRVTKLQHPEDKTVFLVSTGTITQDDLKTLARYIKKRIEQEGIVKEIFLDKKITDNIKIDKKFGIQAIDGFKAHIFNKNYPEFRTSVTFSQIHNGHQTVLDAGIENLSYILPEYANEIKKLTDDHSCVITRENGKLNVIAADYSATWKLDFKSPDFLPLRDIKKIVQDCDEHYFLNSERFEVIKEKLTAMGFSEFQIPDFNKIEFVHNIFPQIDFSTNGSESLKRISTENLDNADKAINEYQRAKIAPSVTTHKFDNKKRINLNLNIPSSLYGSGEEYTLIILDSCVLKDLAFDNPYKRTNVDIIHALSQLPNIFVSIPDIVDYETRGRVSIFGDFGRISQRIRSSSFDNPVELKELSIFNEFFSKITKRYSDHKGDALVKIGENPKIEVWETFFSYQLNRLNLQEIWNKPREILEKVTNAINGPNYGEELSYAMAKNVAFENCNVVFCTSDINFFNKVKNDNFKTSSGNAVSVICTDALFKATMQNPSFIKIMELMYGHSLEKLTYDSLIKGMVNYDGTPKTISDEEKLGINAKNIKAPNIAKVINQGLQKAIDCLKPKPLVETNERSNISLNNIKRC